MSTCDKQPSYIFSSMIYCTITPVIKHRNILHVYNFIVHVLYLQFKFTNSNSDFM